MSAPDAPPAGKRPSESRLSTAILMVPLDANPYGSVHGGVIMRRIDEAAAVAAIRHARRNMVTVSIDRLHFRLPAHVGELVFFRANVNYAGRTSLEVGVRVEAENLFTGVVRHVASAYLSFVAMDEDGKPTPVPPLIPEDDEDRRRMTAAEERRRVRLGQCTDKSIG